MQYKIILFDLDGTIINPEKGVAASVKYALNHFGVKFDQNDKFHRFIGPPLVDSFKNFFDFDDEQSSQALMKYREHYAIHGIEDNDIYEGAEEIFKYLKDKNYQIAVATSKPKVFAEKILKHLNLFDYFDVIEGSDLNESNADKSIIINNALNKFPNLNKKECVMIGDRKFDMIGALENEIDCIGALWGYGTFQELVEYDPKYCLKNFSQMKFVF